MSLLINEDCPICSGKGILLTSIPSNVIGHNISCPRCGNFQIALTTYLADIPKSNNWSPRQRANASGWIREHPGVQLTIDDFKYLGTLPSPTVTERAYKLIIEMEKRSDNIDTYFDFSYDDIKMQEWVAISWSSNLNEIKYLLVNYLLAKGLVIGRILEESDGWTVMDVQLSPSGHELIEKILSKNTDSLMIFA